jgi:hypothetical protein
VKYKGSIEAQWKGVKYSFLGGRILVFDQNIDIKINTKNCQQDKEVNCFTCVCAYSSKCQ